MKTKTVVALYAMIVLWLFVIGLTVCKWLGVFGFISTNLFGEISGVVFAVLFIVVLLKLRFMSYIVNKNGVYISFFGIKLTKIDIKAIWKVLILEESVVVCHTVNNTETTITNILLDKKDFTPFGEAVKAFNERIIVTSDIDDPYDDESDDENN